MSRTKKGSKYPGIEIWSKRAKSKCTGYSPGRWVKQRTASLERAHAKEDILQSLKEDATYKYLHKE